MTSDLGAMQRALVNAGLVNEPKHRHRRGKQFKCRKCGSTMIRPEGTNVMACSGDNLEKNKTCNNFYIFDRN